MKAQREKKDIKLDNMSTSIFPSNKKKKVLMAFLKAKNFRGPSCAAGPWAAVSAVAK